MKSIVDFTNKLKDYFATKQALTNIDNICHKSYDEYKDSQNYEVGTYVIHNGVVYRCKTACTAASWSVNSTCFESSTLLNGLNYLRIISATRQIRSFYVTVPQGSTSYDYSASAPNDYSVSNLISAMSVGGSGAIIIQVGTINLYFDSPLVGNSTIKIVYYVNLI